MMDVYVQGIFDVICLACAGITLLLSMTVFQLIIADKVPESSQAIPLVGMLILMLIVGRKQLLSCYSDIPSFTI